MTDFSSGSVPVLYRDIFAMCSHNGAPIHRDVFQCLLSQSNLNQTQLKIVWDLAGPSQGEINRTNLYKTLALIASAQQGKILNENLLMVACKDYPCPKIVDFEPIKKLVQQLYLNDNPSILGLSYTDITQLDSIRIELVPEKKGLFLKHSEYLVASKRFESKVTRRYNDFLALQELLVSRFPYRLIPRLPPKKIVSDAHFLELRRRGLERWLTLIARHPSIAHDALVAFFLTDSAPDCQHRIRDMFKRAPDEFATSDLAADAKKHVPSDEMAAISRDQMRSLVQIVTKLKALAEGAVERRVADAAAAERCAHELRALSGVLGGGGRWGEMRAAFGDVGRDLAEMAVQAYGGANGEEMAVGERLALLLDVIVAHRDLCERLEKGIANEHQAALAKMLALKKRKIQGAIRGNDVESVAQLETKMLQQENLILNIELRTDFSLYCVHMETQLVFAYLETLSAILNSLVSLRIRSHSEMAELWKGMQPTVQQYFSPDYASHNGKS